MNNSTPKVFNAKHTGCNIIGGGRKAISGESGTLDKSIDKGIATWTVF